MELRRPPKPAEDALLQREPGQGVRTMLRLSCDFLASLRLGLSFTVLLGVAAALGSAVREDFYRSPWFAFILAALFGNLFLCTCRRACSFFRTRSFGPRQVGVLVFHAGLLLVIAGGFVTVTRGEKGFVTLAEGEAAALEGVVAAGRGLSLRLEDFGISYYSDGSPAQFTSRVAVGNGKRTLVRADISVNHPLSCRGVKVYQYSYRWLAELEVREGGRVRKLEAAEGEVVPVEGTALRLKVYRYLPNFHPEWGMESKGLRPDNPRFIFSVYRGEERLGVGMAKPGEQVALGAGAAVAFTGVRPVSVFLVKTDPGQPLVLAGGLALTAGALLLLGCAFAGERKPRGDKEASGIEAAV